MLTIIDQPTLLYRNLPEDNENSYIRRSTPRNLIWSDMNDDIVMNLDLPML